MQAAPNVTAQQAGEIRTETSADIDALAARYQDDAPAPAEGAPADADDPVPACAPFTPEQAQCDAHGPYVLNVRDADGTVRWLTPACPACTRQRAGERLMQRAAIAPRFAHCAFDNFIAAAPAQRLALEKCRHYADDFPAVREQGTCLILRGAPGTGKNHLATAIARSVLARGLTVLNATAHEIVGRIRATWRTNEGGLREGAPMNEAAVLREFAALDLLIIDEVGRAYRARDGGEPIELFNVIDARYRRLAPTIVISNLERDGIRDALGAAAYDRLREGGGKLANFDWGSHRGPAGALDFTATLAANFTGD